MSDPINGTTVYVGDEVRIAPGRSPWRNSAVWMGGWAKVTAVDAGGVTVEPKGHHALRYPWSWVTARRETARSGEPTLRARLADAERTIAEMQRTIQTLDRGRAS